MGSNFEVEGLDELINNIEKLQSKAKSLNGEREVGFDELFTKEFMTEHTEFKSFDELLTYGRFKVENNEDFESIPEVELDELVRKVSDFDSWQEMLEEATTEYYVNQLDF